MCTITIQMTDIFHLPRDIIFEILSFIRTRHLVNLAKVCQHLHNLVSQYVTLNLTSRPIFVEGKHFKRLEKQIHLFKDDSITDFKQVYLKDKYYDSVGFWCHDKLFYLTKLNEHEFKLKFKDIYNSCTKITIYFNKFSKCCYNCGTQSPDNLDCQDCQDTFQICLKCYKGTEFIKCGLCGIRIEESCAECCHVCHVKQCRTCTYDGDYDRDSDGTCKTCYVLGN